MAKHYSRSSDLNKEDILKVFQDLLPLDVPLRLLEVGSGTGQHAVYIAARFPQLQWVTSDKLFKQDALKATLKEAKLRNVHGPEHFEVGRDELPKQKFDIVYASQVLHLLAWKDTKSLIKMLGNRLRKDSLVMFYGAFKYEGQLPSERFVELEKTLKEHDPKSGIRAFEDVSKAMAKAGFALLKDLPMPLENRFLVFNRLEHVSTDPSRQRDRIKDNQRP